MKLAFINFIFISIIALTIIGCNDAAIITPKPTDIIKLAVSSDGTITMTGARNATNNVSFTVQTLSETAAITLGSLPPGRIFLTGFKTNTALTPSSPITVTIKLPAAYTPGEKFQVYIKDSLTWKPYSVPAVVSSNGTEATFKIYTFSPFIIVSNNYKLRLNNDFSLHKLAEVNSGTGDFAWTAVKKITPSLAMIKKSTTDYDLIAVATTGNYSASPAAVADNDTWLIRTVQNNVGYVYYKLKFISVGDNSVIFKAVQLQEVTGAKVLIQQIFAGGNNNKSIAYGKMICKSDDPSQVAYTGQDGIIYKVSPVPGSISIKAIALNDPATVNGAVCPNFIPDQGNNLCFMTGAYTAGNYSNNNLLHLMKVSSLNPIPQAFILHPIDPLLLNFDKNIIGLNGNKPLLPSQMSVSRNAERIVGLWSTGMFGIDFGGNTANYIKLDDAANIKNFAISPGGVDVAISKTDNKIYMRGFYGTEVLIGDGNWPSFNADGTKLGYMNDGEYNIKDLLTGTTKSYELPFGTIWSAPALAPAANSIIFRAADGGMSLGLLID